MPPRVTARDLDTGELLNTVGPLPSPTIKQACFPGCSDRITRRRLHHLVEMNFLRRLTIGMYHNGNGRLPYAYGLTPYGAEVLYEKRGVTPRQVLTDVPSPTHVAHTLAVSQFVHTLRQACQRLPLALPAIIFEYDLTDAYRNDPKPTTPYQQRYILHEKFTPVINGQPGKPFSCRADTSFKLVVGQHTLLGYLEADRSTQPLRVLRAKAKAYHQLIAVEHRYRKHWPNLVEPSIRVYCTVESKRRLKSLAAGLLQTPGAELFRIAVTATLSPETILTEPVWYTIESPNSPIPLLRV